MLFTSLRQLPELLCMMYCGIVTGVVYDLLGIFRRRGRRWLVHLSDFVFCLAALFCCAFFLFIGAQGEIHFYHFLGLLAGFGVEALGFRPIIKFILDIIERALYNLYKRIRKLTLFKKLTR